MDGTANLDVHTLGIIGLAVGATIALSFTLLSMVLRGMLALHIWAGAFWLLTLAGLAEGYDENGTFLSAIVGSVLIAAANGAMLGGIAVHIKYPLRWRWPALLIAAFLAIQVAFFIAPPPQAVEATVFGVKSIIGRSNYLSDVNIEKELSLNVIKQLKSNKTLKATLDDEETKAAFISALKNFVDELEQNK